MAYLLRGGPRDQQLVDDLPRGYRPVEGGESSPFGGIVFEAAVWRDGSGPEGAAVGEPPNLRAL